MEKFVLSVLVENHAGVLSRVSGLFSRRGYNIDSLTVCETNNPGQSRMTIVVKGDEHTLDQIEKQLLDFIKSGYEWFSENEDFILENYLGYLNIDFSDIKEIENYLDTMKLEFIKTKEEIIADGKNPKDYNR